LTLDPPGAAVVGGVPSSASQSYATGSRSSGLSFAFVVKNRLLAPNPQGRLLSERVEFAVGNARRSVDSVISAYAAAPGGFEPPYLTTRYNVYTPSNLQILIFNRRSTARPYALVRGCIYSGSSRATLSWDPDVTAAPPIRRGTWLMEATISPGLRDTTLAPPDGPAALPPVAALALANPPPAPAATYVKYRHALEFYRVSAVDEPKLDPSTRQVSQTVTFERPVTEFPISHSDGDARAMPDPYDPAAAYTFSGDIAFPNVIDATSANNAITVSGPVTVRAAWLPIIIWDGLYDVFEVRN
jgi:hypothetical protein